MSTKKVFILGAGFSKNAGIPLQDEFLKWLIESNTNLPSSHDELLDKKIIEHIKKFLQ